MPPSDKERKREKSHNNSTLKYRTLPRESNPLLVSYHATGVVFYHNFYRARLNGQFCSSETQYVQTWWPTDPSRVFCKKLFVDF